MIDTRTIAVSAVAGAVLAAFGAVAATRWYYRAEIADMQRDRAQQLTDATQLARMTEQARWAAREGVINDAKKQAVAAAADADTARAASERLRQQVAQLQRRARDTAAAGGGQGQSGAATLDLLVGLLGGMDQAGRDISRYADQLEVAGLSCERISDSLQDGLAR